MAARSAEKNCKAFDRRKGCYSDCYKGLQREMAARSAGKKSKAFYKGESRYKAFFFKGTGRAQRGNFFKSWSTSQ